MLSIAGDLTRTVLQSTLKQLLSSEASHQLKELEEYTRRKIQRVDGTVFIPEEREHRLAELMWVTFADDVVVGHHRIRQAEGKRAEEVARWTQEWPPSPLDRPPPTPPKSRRALALIGTTQVSRYRKQLNFGC